MNGNIKIFYICGISCKNCGNGCHYEIPVGTTKEEFFKVVRCGKCGCDILGRTLSKSIKEKENDRKII
jgi:hypothetical protein